MAGGQSGVVQCSNIYGAACRGRVKLELKVSQVRNFSNQAEIEGPLKSCILGRKFRKIENEQKWKDLLTKMK